MGKTYLATILAIAAIHQGKRMSFYNAVDLVNQLDMENNEVTPGDLATQLVIMDAR